MRNSAVFLLALLGAVPGLVFAQTAPANGATVLVGANTLELASFVGAVQTAGQGVYGIFLDEGVGLVSILVAIMMAWHLMRALLGPVDNIQRAQIWTLGLQIFMVLLMLSSWTPTSSLPSGIANSFHLPNLSVQDLFVSSFDCLQQKILTQGGGQASLTCGASARDIAAGTPLNSANSIGKALADIEDAHTARDAARRAASVGLSLWDKIGQYIESLLARLVDWVLDLGVTAGSLLLMGLALFSVAMGQVLTTVGMCLGPLMVPCMVFSPLRDRLWTGWLGYMLWVGFYKLVAALMIVLAFRSIGPVQMIATQMLQAAVVQDPSKSTLIIDLLGAFMTLYYLLFGIVLMLRVSSITSQLVK